MERPVSVAIIPIFVGVFNYQPPIGIVTVEKQYLATNLDLKFLAI